MATKFEVLSSLPAIRERAGQVYKLAKDGKANNFELHEDRLDATADLVTQTILECFKIAKLDDIPPHGRWQHFETGDVPRLQGLLKEWTLRNVDNAEQCRRLVDLFLVSVLLDAGAGNDWKYHELPGDIVMERSEGLAVASLHMFIDGAFGDGKLGVVNGNGLQRFTIEKLVAGMQVGTQNPLTGVEGRTALLQSLGKSLLLHSDIFGKTGRPGNLIDYMLAGEQGSELDILKLWSALQQLLLPIWPTDRTKVGGKAIGDAWPSSALKKSSAYKESHDVTSAIQPFHKLTQWLTYSLMVPFTRILGLKWKNSQYLTGLPEYRNGGLFIDMGVLVLRESVLSQGLENSGETLPQFKPCEDVIVEWRALTVILLDIIHNLVNDKLYAAGAKVSLSLAQVLEAGTWKAGRILAAEKRPETRSSPILLLSDGTLF